jgi:uncharacterized membrane protein HdeD (DUF308 family)
MQVRKQNPNRWYLVMVFCLLVSFGVFVIGPRIGYAIEDAHAFAIMIGLWAPTLGVLGVRAELLQKKE